MGSLMHTVLRLGALSAGAGAIAVSRPIRLFLAFGLIALYFNLVAVLALTGTFGAPDKREAAQAVLPPSGPNQPVASTTANRADGPHRKTSIRMGAASFPDGDADGFR